MEKVKAKLPQSTSDDKPDKASINTAMSHAEGNAAALMTLAGVTSASLYINYHDGPCFSCKKALEAMLTEGTTLKVYHYDKNGKISTADVYEGKMDPRLLTGNAP